MEIFFQDLRCGLRMLLRTPMLSGVALLTLALGIGANTAVFSVVNSVLLRPLPYAEPDRLMMVWQDDTRKGVREGRVSYPNFLDWRAQSEVFEAMSAFLNASITLKGESGTEQLSGARVSTNFFSVVGVSPAMGRAFLPEEEVPD